MFLPDSEVRRAGEALSADGGRPRSGRGRSQPKAWRKPQHLTDSLTDCFAQVWLLGNGRLRHWPPSELYAECSTVYGPHASDGPAALLDGAASVGPRPVDLADGAEQRTAADSGQRPAADGAGGEAGSVWVGGASVGVALAASPAASEPASSLRQPTRPASAAGSQSALLAVVGGAGLFLGSTALYAVSSRERHAARDSSRSPL